MKANDIVKDIVTNESFKVLSIEGKGEYAWVTLQHLKHEIMYSNYYFALADMVVQEN